MVPEQMPTPATVDAYLRSLPRTVRWLLWLTGRRYLPVRFLDRPRPLVIIAHRFRDSKRARQLALAVEQDWFLAPAASRETYEEILLKAPGLVIVQLRRKNICGCLGHRHVAVKEAPFAVPHEATGTATTGEMDIACDAIENWLALPLAETALDARYLEGSRLQDFHAQRFRLRMLSVLLHEINHLVFPKEPESSVRERSMAFYRDALANYVESTISTMSFTIDRSFSRLG